MSLKGRHVNIPKQKLYLISGASKCDVSVISKKRSPPHNISVVTTDFKFYLSKLTYKTFISPHGVMLILSRFSLLSIVLIPKKTDSKFKTHKLPIATIELVESTRH